MKCYTFFGAKSIADPENITIELHLIKGNTFEELRDSFMKLIQEYPYCVEIGYPGVIPGYKVDKCSDTFVLLIDSNNVLTLEEFLIPGETK